MSRKTSRWLIPLLTVSSGALMIFVGSLVRGDYAPQVWVQLGSTVVLFGPLYWLQWIFERGVSEVRQQTQETRSSVEQLSHDIETIRQQAVAGLEDLRDVALENVQQRRQTDDEVTVPPARPVRQRQLAGAGGGAGRRERDRAARRHGTRRGRARAAPGSLVGAAACRRLGRFAGLAIATPQPLPGRRAVRSRRGARAADAPAPRCDRGANPTPVREPAHASTQTGDRAAERRMGHHRGRPAEPFLRDRLHRQGPVRPGQRGEGLLISGGGASRKASRGVAGRAAPPPVSRFQELPMMRETEGGMYVQEDDNLIFAGLADPTGPFGNPDGSRAPIENILDQFVDFRGNPAFGALATRPDDATTRVIVGRLGAGKTVYLRRLRNFQARQDSVFADHPQQNLPSTEAIVKACQWFPEQFLTEKWMQVWSRAVLSALSTHLLAHEELRPYVTHEQAESIRSDYGHLLGAFRRPRSIYGELRTIINGQNTGRQLTNHLEDPAWDDLEDVLATMLRTCPPIFFYLD